MEEKTINTVKISLEEFEELIDNTNFHNLFFYKLTDWKSQLRVLENRLLELERKVNNQKSRKGVKYDRTRKESH